MSVAVLLGANNAFAQEEPRIEILHFWAAESEQKALGVFRDAAIDAGISWQETVIKGNRDTLQLEFSSLMTIGSPPSVVHWVTDGQLNELIDRDVFAAIPDREGKYKDLYIPEVYELISSEKGLTSAAVGIHSYNFLIYNKSLLEKYDLEPAKDLGQLLEYGELLKKDGIYLTSLSHQSWQLRYPVLTAFASEMTANEARQFLTEGTDISHLKPNLVRSLQFFEDILEFNDPNTADQDWTESVRKMEEGKALMLFMGDFAVPQFKDQESIVCQPSPNSNDMYVGMDSFAFPNVNDPDLKAGQIAFINISTDPRLVAQYVNLKGGLPTIKNVNPDNLLPCHAKNLERWMTAEKIWVRSEKTTRRYAAFTQFLAVQAKHSDMDAEQMADELINLMNSFY